MDQFVRYCLFTGILLLADPASAAEDCAAAEEYYALAESSRLAFDSENEIRFLRNAAESCGRFRYWYELGRVIADTGIPSEPSRAPSTEAKDAFAQALRFAERGSDQATAILAWGEAAYQAGDPSWEQIRAEVTVAEELDAENQQVKTLLARLDERILNMSEDEMRGSLSQGVGRVSLNARTVIGSEDPSASASGGGTTLPKYSGPSLSRPIFFRTGSVEIDDGSTEQVRRLAAAMSAPELEDRRFLVIGHADARGDEYSNLELSRRRAARIVRDLQLLAPSLEGRLESEGRGEYDLVVPQAVSEEQHRRNRRIEVMLQ